MLRGTEKWITYIVLAIIVIFGIVFLAKQIGITMDLKDSLMQARQAGIRTGDLPRIAQLHNASSKIFFLSFFSLCFLLTGIVIIMKGIQRAYDIAEVKEKVRHYLKSTTPGVVMVVLATFLLAFCSYRTSNIEAVYSSRMIDYNNYKLAMEDWKKPAIGLQPKVDSSILKQLRTPAKAKVADIKDKPGKKTTPVAAIPHDPEHKKTEAGKKSVAKSVQKTSGVKESKPVALKSAGMKKKKPASGHVAVAGKSTVTPSPRAGRDKAYDSQPVTQADVDWANQFQRNVTIYGYVPTRQEEARYDRVRKYYEQHDGNIMNDELNWAYSFLEKTKKGYEPKPGELMQYEAIIQRNIKSTVAHPARNREAL